MAALLASLFVTVGGVTSAQAAEGNILPPFDTGQTWNICQGYNTSHTHKGTSAYGIDLTGAGCDSSAAGRNVRAPMSGTVYYYQAEFGNLCVNVPGGRSYTLTHINSGITSGMVSAGQLVGTVAAANTAGNRGVAHIHFQMWATPNCYSSSGIPFDSAHGARICGAPDLTASGPSGGNGTWSGTAITGAACGGTTTPPPPDTDGDGTPDYSDECRNIPGLAHQQGCRQPMATYQGDYNGDGKKDVAAFYAYPERGNAMGLFVWDGNGNGTFAAPRQPWYTASGWEWRRVIPAGAGDYNGDGRTDLSVFYRYDSGVVRVITLYAASNGTFNAVFSPEQTGMEGFNLIPAGVGDYNGDGRPDIASFYRYPERGNALGLLVWASNSDGTFGYAQVKWYAATGWEGHRLIPAGVGTFDADNRTDISAFYRYDGNVVRMWTWRANVDGTFSEPTVTFNTSGGWDGSHLIPMGAGDYNGDGNQDIASFYGYPERGNALGVFVWYGNGNGTFSSPSQVWYTASGWEWLRVIPASVGDFNADGRTDLSMFYRYDGNVVRMFTWLATPTAFQHPTETFYSGGGWDGNHLLT